MAPPHTQAQPAGELRQTTLTDLLRPRRPGRVAKPSNHSLNALRAAPATVAPYIPPSAAPVPPGPLATPGGLQAVSVLNTFRLIRDSRVETREEYNDLDGPRTRRSYTREHKLAAITYATSTYVEDNNGNFALIKAYKAARSLFITQTMLKRWIGDFDKILAQTKGTRKNRVMEDRLAAEFLVVRGVGRAIGNRWFLRHARCIFESIHPERVHRPDNFIIPVYDGFKFSRGWFSGFKNRYNISLRRRTKLSQTAPEDVYDKIQSWLQFNRRNSQPTVYTFGPGRQNREVGKYRLSEISNMDQTPLSFEFMDNRTYNQKGADTVWIKVAKSGWDKRQATLQVCKLKLQFSLTFTSLTEPVVY
jgi:hypothetical protein